MLLKRNIETESITLGQEKSYGENDVIYQIGMWDSLLILAYTPDRPRRDQRF